MVRSTKYLSILLYDFTWQLYGRFRIEGFKYWHRIVVIKMRFKQVEKEFDSFEIESFSHRRPMLKMKLCLLAPRSRFMDKWCLYIILAPISFLYLSSIYHNTENSAQNVDEQAVRVLLCLDDPHNLVSHVSSLINFQTTHTAIISFFIIIFSQDSICEIGKNFSLVAGN